MGSYEERVVDRGVDQAWMQLRLRLADLLTSATAEEPIGIAFTPLAAGDGDEAPTLIVDADGTDISVRILTDDLLDSRFEFDPAERWRLVELGMKIENGGPVLLVDANEVDRAAYYAYSVLHEMWEVLHPSFMAIDPEDSGLVDEPKYEEKSAPVDLPDLVHVSSLQSLNEWVAATLTPEFGHTPVRDEDGDICVSGKKRSRAIVSVRSEHRIEVWTILARDVDRKKARRQVDRLSRQYSFHRFFVVNDMLVASIVLFADPFVPSQLVRALQGTLFVSGRLGSLGKKLKNPTGERTNSVSELDPRLMSLFVSGRRMPTAELVETAVNLAGGSETTLRAWRQRSASACREAHRLLSEHGDVNDVHRRSKSSWRRVIRALDLALAEVAPGSRDAA